MTNQDQKSFEEDCTDQESQQDHWGGLASELGAELPTETHDPEVKTASDDLPVAFDAVPSNAKMPKATAGDWGGLAESLGVTTDETGNDSASEKSVADEEKQSKTSGRRRRRGRRGGRGRRHEQTAEEGSASEAVAEGAEIAALGADVEAIESVVEFTVDVESVEIETGDQITGVSDDESGEEVADSKSAGDGSRPRRRRRRGGRRSRGRRNENAESEEKPVSSEGADSEDAEDSESDNAGADDLGEIDDRSGHRGGRHRNIVTWNECIGVIVSTNLESRTKNNGNGDGRGGRAQGRGKSSGGGKGRARRGVGKEDEPVVEVLVVLGPREA